MTNVQTIRNFVSAWSRLDPNELANYFTDDGTYHNMPIQPVAGKDNVKVFIEHFIANWTAADWEIVNIIENNNTVFCERIDKTKSTQGNVELPCFGVFEMRDGKIHVWRDYFDLSTYSNAMS